MNKLFFLLTFLTSLATVAFSQDKPVKFSVAISADSVLLGNYFEVKFTLENANGQGFEAPAFEAFNVVSGPNFSSSMSMVNGAVTQSMTVTYYLEPKDAGNYWIAPASIEADGKTLETTPLEVLVAPNPDGIQQSPPRKNDRKEFHFGDPFDMDREFSFPAPEPQEMPKKKRKTTRI